MENTNLPIVIDNETGFVIDEANEESEATKTIETLFETEANAQKTGNIISTFVDSYSRHKNSLPLDVWLNQEFANYPTLWQNDEERFETTATIIKTVQEANDSKADLFAHLDKGKSRESWLAKKIEQNANQAGVVNVGNYAQRIDNALDTANQNNWNVITRNDGAISQARNLDGFIAEHHHANTFNVDAASKGSSYRAKVLEPAAGETYGKNSMDIGIYDSDGKLVRRYQAKYGADADKTTELFERGDYRGQRKLVPEGHADANSTEIIEIDGVSSKPLSKEAAKELQEKAQREAEAKQYDWNDASRIDIAKNIGKQAVVAAAMTAGFQGARILGRRVWNSLTGKENQSANEDLKEFFDSSISSATNVGVQVAVSGGLVVAAKSGWIGVLKNTPAGQIANIAYVATENAKCLYKFAKGEMSATETLDAMGSTNASAIGGLYGAMQGAAYGLAFGGVGAFVGAVVGGLAGSSVGEAIYQGSKAIVKTAVSVVKSAYSSVKSVAKSAWNTVKSWF
ncbi:MAG: hypothetical protein QX194_06965 [Methylococcales bacterium]